MSAQISTQLSYLIHIEEADGTAVTGAVIGDLVIAACFNGADHTLTAALTEKSAGDYILAVTLPSTVGSLSWRVTHTTATHIVSPGYFAVNTEAYDHDALAALITRTGGTSGSALLLEDTSLGDVIVGDAWQSSVLAVADAILDQWSYSDCTGFADNELQAAIRLDVADTTEYPITTAWVSKADNQFRISWDTFPSALKSAISGNLTTTLYIDVQIIDTDQTPDRLFTVGRYTLNAKWERDSRTAVA